MSDAEKDKRQAELLAKLRALAASESEESDEGFALTVTEQRISYIVNSMVNGGWITGVSHQQLADVWGLSLRRVDALAAEASRVIRRYYREDEETRKDMLARHCQTMERLAKKAEDIGSQRGFRDAIEATKTLAQLQGVLTHKLEHEVHDPRLSFFHGWTRDEKEHFAVTGQRPARLMKEDGPGVEG